MSLIGMRIEGTKIVFEKDFDSFIEYVTQNCPTYLVHVNDYCVLVKDILTKVNDFLLNDIDLITIIEKSNILILIETNKLFIDSIETTTKKMMIVYLEKKIINTLSTLECLNKLSIFLINYENLEKYRNITNYNILTIFDITIEGTIDEPKLNIKFNYLIYNIKNDVELADVLKKLEENIKELNITKEKININDNTSKYINIFEKFISYLNKKIEIIHEQLRIINKQKKLEEDKQKKLEEDKQKKIKKETLKKLEEKKKKKKKQKNYLNNC